MSSSRFSQVLRFSGYISGGESGKRITFTANFPSSKLRAVINLIRILIVVFIRNPVGFFKAKGNISLASSKTLLSESPTFKCFLNFSDKNILVSVYFIIL